MFQTKFSNCWLRNPYRIIKYWKETGWTKDLYCIHQSFNLWTLVVRFCRDKYTHGIYRHIHMCIYICLWFFSHGNCQVRVKYHHSTVSYSIHWLDHIFSIVDLEFLNILVIISKQLNDSEEEEKCNWKLTELTNLI